MDQLIVVTHPEQIQIEAEPIEHEATPADAVALGYYHDGNLIARGVVAPEAVDAIKMLVESPVSVALAASLDEQGNIDARVCLVIPVDPSDLGGSDDDEDEPAEPWKASVPVPPSEQPSEEPQMALLPIGHVVRLAADRRHEEEVELDVWEMLENLLGGRARDAASKAIDDLLNSL